MFVEETYPRRLRDSSRNGLENFWQKKVSPKFFFACFDPSVDFPSPRTIFPWVSEDGMALHQNARQ